MSFDPMDALAAKRSEGCLIDALNSIGDANKRRIWERRLSSYPTASTHAAVAGRIRVAHRNPVPAGYV